ncbi:hypothetical protein AAF712_012701 [Marasmius tenuissimus]|uniref:F-box domain-containing protein n=1 Tax=Marasmius tenuissimus TaxID=585030 RepID=A0ABR2ZHT1_9AGAR
MLDNLPDSPFAAVLDTNYAPSPQEIIEMKELLIDPSNRLKDLNKEISRLEAERRRLQTFVDKHKAVLSPFRRFSAELMAEIFTQCLPAGFQTRDIQQAPLLLTRVCRSWRTMALGTPKLWDAIHINLPVPLNEQEQHLYNQLLHARKGGLELWLDRSTTMPINISVSMPPLGPEIGIPVRRARPHFDLDRSFYQEIGSLVARHSRRWKTITLTHIPDNIMDSFISQLSHGSLPLLENISVTALPTDLERPQMLLVHLLDATEISRLRQLHISCIPESIFELKTRHWLVLTHLHVVNPITNLLPSVLIEHFARIFPSLIECVLSFGHTLSRGVMSMPYTGPPTSWRKLRKLSLTFQPSFGAQHRLDLAIAIEEVRNVFNAILTPSLTELAIHHNVYLSPADTQRLYQQVETPFHEFLIQSGCASTLTHLGVNLLVREEVLLRSLELLSSLKCLSVTHERPTLERPMTSFRAAGNASNADIGPPRTFLGQRFFRELTPGFQLESGGIVCPCLEELEIAGCSSVVVDAVLQLAQMRARPPGFNIQVAPLRSLRVNFDAQPKEVVDSHHVRSELDRLKARGVSVEWRWVDGEVYVIDRPSDGIPALW